MKSVDMSSRNAPRGEERCTPHLPPPISPAGIQRNHKPEGRMAWGWGGGWDCFYLHLFYNKIQSLCCDRIRHQEVSRFGCFCCYSPHRPIWYILMWDWLDRNPLSCKCSIYLNIPCKRKVLILFSVLLDNFSALPYVLGVPKSIHHFRWPKCTLFTPRSQISVFPGYHSRPKRNWRQRLCKILEGKQGATRSLWKWWIPRCAL